MLITEKKVTQGWRAEGADFREGLSEVSVELRPE